MRICVLGSVAALGLGTTLASAQASVQASVQARPFQVVDHWKIGGAGGWDYLLADPGAHRLYVTHGTRVEVLDTTTGKVVGAVTGLKGTHGVALDPDGKVGYISDGGANAVVVFDRQTFATLASISAGSNPDGITYEPVTRTVWAFNGRSKNVTVIDTASRTAVATIALPGKPEFPQPDGKGHVFDNIEDKNSIVMLDAKSRTLVATWPVAGCESPSGMAIDTKGNRLFPVCDGKKMAIVDAGSGKELGLADIGDGPDAAGYSSKDGQAFSSNGDGTVTVVDTKPGFRTLQQVVTAKGARTMSYDSGTDRIYAVTADQGPRPEPTASNPRPRPAIVPDTFQVLVLARK